MNELLMILTPTYHVFEMLKVHQGAAFIPTELAADVYTLDGNRVPVAHASASRDNAGKLQLSLANLPAREAVTLLVRLGDGGFGAVTGRVLTGAGIDAHNTFDAPERVKPAVFEDFRRDGESLRVRLPAASVAVLEIATT